MDDAKFLAVAQKLKLLSDQYQSNQLKHYQYVTNYDQTLEAYGITKKDLVAEIERRRKYDFQSEVPVQSVPSKPVPKRR